MRAAKARTALVRGLLRVAAMPNWIAVCLIAALSNACSPVDCDYDLEGNPVNCRNEDVAPTGGALPQSPSVTLDGPTAYGIGGATRIAVGGTATFHYTAIAVTALTTSIEAPFAITGEVVESNHDLGLVAISGGASTLVVTDPDVEDVTATADVVAIPFGSIGFEIGGYTPQLGPNAAVLSRAEIVVRLRGPNGEALIDSSLTASSGGANSDTWDVFDVAGAPCTTSLNLTASSFGTKALPIAFVDPLESIEFTVGAPAASQLVCAYGLTNGVEVAASFTLFANGPGVSQEGGDSNCIRVDLDGDYADIVANDSNGHTATTRIFAL